YVVFGSAASNLVTGDTNDSEDLFVRDRVLGTTERISISTAGDQSDTIPGTTYAPTTISSDGRYVVFAWDGDGLVTGDTNGVRDIFVRDRVAGTTERISLSSD